MSYKEEWQIDVSEIPEEYRKYASEIDECLMSMCLMAVVEVAYET
jgi:hypothetical protein